jgi:xylan 1,4-beta-xylosidase
VYTELDGEPVYDFSVVDEIYDRLLDIGLRPVVELGFMPRDLALDPSLTVFEYGAIISPPKDYSRWASLVQRLVEHLVERYGLKEVLTWDFEVWNEANLEVFWSGTKAEWLQLYDVTAAAVKAVDPRLAVGGPSSAAAGWVDDLLAHAAASGSAVDFVSTHTYGSPPLDVQASLDRHGFGDARILWTEWGVTPTHFNPLSDSVFSGIFLLRGMRSAAGRVDALAYWVASDHFEELGRPPRLLHGGFGLQTVGGLAKPRFHALTLLSRLGPVELPVTLEGDGAGSLVEAWASRDRDRLAVLVWNLTLDQTKAAGSPDLTRTVRLELPGADPTWQATATTLAVGVGDLTAAAAELGIGDWPESDQQWRELGVRSQLVSRPLEWNGSALDLILTMPSAVLLEFHPGRG